MRSLLKSQLWDIRCISELLNFSALLFILVLHGEIQAQFQQNIFSRQDYKQFAFIDESDSLIVIQANGFAYLLEQKKPELNIVHFNLYKFEKSNDLTYLYDFEVNQHFQINAVYLDSTERLSVFFYSLFSSSIASVTRSGTGRQIFYSQYGPVNAGKEPVLLLDFQVQPIHFFIEIDHDAVRDEFHILLGSREGNDVLFTRYDLLDNSLLNVKYSFRSSCELDSIVSIQWGDDHFFMSGFKFDLQTQDTTYWVYSLCGSEQSDSSNVGNESKDFTPLINTFSFPIGASVEQIFVNRHQQLEVIVVDRGNKRLRLRVFNKKLEVMSDLSLFSFRETPYLLSFVRCSQGIFVLSNYRSIKEGIFTKLHFYDMDHLLKFQSPKLSFLSSAITSIQHASYDDSHVYFLSTKKGQENPNWYLHVYDVSGNYSSSDLPNLARSASASIPSLFVRDAQEIFLLNTLLPPEGGTSFHARTYTLFKRSYPYYYEKSQGASLSENYDHDTLVESGLPSYLLGKILIRFREGVLIPAILQDRYFLGGALYEFLPQAYLLALEEATAYSWNEWKAFKVFKHVSSLDTISITRLGDTIRSDALWNYLSIDLPDGVNPFVLGKLLERTCPFIKSASPDVLGRLYSDDTYYQSRQFSLNSDPIYSLGSIHIEEAWQLSAGSDLVKVGVMDAPINWAHEDFNGSPFELPMAGRKIAGGYNYYNFEDIHLYDQYLSYPHGTAVAGIIGAKRNNIQDSSEIQSRGIAGIAGGDEQKGQLGVQLFSLGITNNGQSFVPMEVIAAALYDAYSNVPNYPRSFALNVINGSWGTTSNPHLLLHEVLVESWRNHCIYVAARGNHTFLGGNHLTWPACFEDNLLLSVIAGDNQGNRKEAFPTGSSSDWGSNYGISSANNHVGCSADFIAPGTSEMIYTTYPFDEYASFSGTSAAAAHVSGVVALMQSVHRVENGYPNLLSTEDVEAILEKTAKDRGGPGFDLESGYGLIDAGKAMQRISSPYYIEHLTSIPSRSVTNGLQIRLYSSNNEQGEFGKVYFNCTKVILDWDIQLQLPDDYEILDWWELEASTTKGVNPAPYMNNLMDTRRIDTETVNNPLGSNFIHRKASAATYYINDVTNPFWFPMHPDLMRYYFSVHIKGTGGVHATAIEEEVKVRLFPNPSSSTITIDVGSSERVESYVIYSAFGKKLMEGGKSQSDSIELNIEHLAAGIYFAEVYYRGKRYVLPFMKAN